MQLNIKRVMFLLTLVCLFGCTHISADKAPIDADTLEEWVLQGELELQYIGQPKTVFFTWR